jgi:hypothetical protein
MYILLETDKDCELSHDRPVLSTGGGGGCPAIKTKQQLS